jgi:hypothetical protein
MGLKTKLNKAKPNKAKPNKKNLNKKNPDQKKLIKEPGPKELEKRSWTKRN